jgi:hypothetical protein
MSTQLKRKFALCGVLLAFVAAAVPTVASAQNGADDPAPHGGHGGHGGDDGPGHK